MVSWEGVMRACGAVATCVWLAYGLRPSHFDCLCWEGIQLTCMNGVRGSALVFYPERVGSIPSRGCDIGGHTV